MPVDYLMISQLLKPLSDSKYIAVSVTKSYLVHGQENLGFYTYPLPARPVQRPVGLLILIYIKAENSQAIHFSATYRKPFSEKRPSSFPQRKLQRVEIIFIRSASGWTN